MYAVQTKGLVKQYKTKTAVSSVFDAHSKLSANYKDFHLC